MIIIIGIFILIIFGIHALIEFLTGGYHSENNDCEFHRSRNRHSSNDDDIVFDYKAIK